MIQQPAKQARVPLTRDQLNALQRRIDLTTAWRDEARKHLAKSRASDASTDDQQVLVAILNAVNHGSGARAQLGPPNDLSHFERMVAACERVLAKLTGDLAADEAQRAPAPSTADAQADAP